MKNDAASSTGLQRPLRVAIVAPTLAILGGHSMQARQMLTGWQDYPAVVAVPSAFLRDVVARFGLSARVVPDVFELSRFSYCERPTPSPRLAARESCDAYTRAAVRDQPLALYPEALVARRRADVAPVPVGC